MTSIGSNNETIVKARLFVSDLLDPIGWDNFVSEFWQREPLHTSLRAGIFEDYATPAQVRLLVESGAPWQFRRMPEIYLDGERVPHDDLVTTYMDMDGREARAPRLKRIKALLETGATVNAFGQESHFPRLAEARARFAAAFGAEVEIATFYSQDGHQGLAPHYDCVEVFVLQIAGSKRWHVSSQRVTSPVVGYGTGTWFDPSAPHAQIDLEPGDMLYIPRGTFHQAIAQSAESLHVTVAVKMPTYLDMLTALVNAAPNVDAMRDYLPLSGNGVEEPVRTILMSQISAVLQGNEFETSFRELVGTRSRY